MAGRALACLGAAWRGEAGYVSQLSQHVAASRPKLCRTQGQGDGAAGRRLRTASGQRRCRGVAWHGGGAGPGMPWRGLAGRGRVRFTTCRRQPSRVPPRCTPLNGSTSAIRRTSRRMAAYLDSHPRGQSGARGPNRNGRAAQGRVSCYDMRKMGRKRVHASNAARQRAYRERSATSSPKKPLPQRQIARFSHLSVRSVQRLVRMRRWDDTILEGWCDHQLEQPDASIRGVEERAQTRILFMIQDFTPTDLERVAERVSALKRRP